MMIKKNMNNKDIEALVKDNVNLTYEIKNQLLSQATPIRSFSRQGLE